MKALEIIVAVSIVCSMISPSYANPNMSKESKDKLSCQSFDSSKISWKYNGQSIANGSKYTITNEETNLQIKSFLYINYITVADEGLYQCVEDNNEMSELTLTVLPTKPTPNTLYSKVVRIGEYFEVDCGVTLGDVTVKEQCAIIKLRVNNDLMDSTSSSNYLNYTRTPTFKFPVVSKSDREYHCIIYFQGPSPCTITDEPFNGPVYKVYHHPDVTMESNSTSSVVPESEAVSFNCSYQDNNQMNSDNYAIHWTVTDAITNQVLMAYDDNNVSNNTATIVLHPSTDVNVRCAVNSTISGGYVIENTTSSHLTIIPDITRDNVHVYSKHCGNNLTIVPNFPHEYSQVRIEHDIPEQTQQQQNVTEVALFAVIDGIRGNQRIVTIPTSCKSNSSVTLRLNSCGNSEDKQLVRKTVSLLLDSVTDKCEEQVCPKLDSSDWRITTIQNCVVNIDFDSVPQSLIEAIVSFCSNGSKECDTDIITTLAPSPTITNSPTSTSPTDDTYMPNWMIICACSFGILLILATTLIVCVVCKCLKSMKKRNNRQRRNDPESGHVTTLRMETINDHHLNVPSNGHGSSSSTNQSRSDSNRAPNSAETSSQTSSRFTDASSMFTSRQSQYTNRSGQSRHSSCQGKQSHNGSLYSYSSSDRYSRCSDNSRRSGSSSRSGSRAPLKPSPLSQTSFKHDPTVGVTTVSLNITINNPDNDLMAKMTKAGQLEIAQPLFRMFNDLGALEIEKQTLDSGATGFLSSRDPSTFRSEHLSNRGGSSGYGGSHQPHFVDNDPNILNPFGKSGFTTNSSDSDDSSSLRILHGEKREPLHSCSHV